VSKRQKVVIDDLTLCNKIALDRAEAAETELKILRRFLSLWDTKKSEQTVQIVEMKRKPSEAVINEECIKHMQQIRDYEDEIA